MNTQDVIDVLASLAVEAQQRLAGETYPIADDPETDLTVERNWITQQQVVDEIAEQLGIKAEVRSKTRAKLKALGWAGMEP